MRVNVILEFSLNRKVVGVILFTVILFVAFLWKIMGAKKRLRFIYGIRMLMLFFRLDVDIEKLFDFNISPKHR